LKNITSVIRNKKRECRRGGGGKREAGPKIIKKAKNKTKGQRGQQGADCDPKIGKNE